MKKGIVSVVVILLMLLVMVSATIALQIFYTKFSSDVFSKLNTKPNNFLIDIVGISALNSKTSIYIKSEGSSYAIIKEIKLNDSKCKLLGSDILDGKSFTKIDVDCLTTKKQKEDIFVITDLGLSQETRVVR